MLISLPPLAVSGLLYRFHTAYASIESAVEAVRAGAVDYLPKPFSPDQVRLAADAARRCSGEL